MGMDVYGVKPKNEKGEYFRNNVWWWRPLWDYCLDFHPSVADKVKDGHSNSGDGLNAGDSKKLAAFIKKDLDSGKAQKYAQKREEELNSLPDVPCEYCETTGSRTWQPHEGPNDTDTVQIKTCNSCKGKGSVRPWPTQYPFSVENLAEFQEFLDNCGGFSIC
jgi:DnaJ-class molecular chaperone